MLHATSHHMQKNRNEAPTVNWDHELLNIDVQQILNFLDQVEDSLKYFFEVVVPLVLLIDPRRLDEITTIYPDRIIGSKPEVAI